MWMVCNDAVLSTVLKYMTVFTVVVKLFPKIRMGTFYRPCEKEGCFVLFEMKGIS
jgi:hypothetical protein